MVTLGAALQELADELRERVEFAVLDLAAARAEGSLRGEQNALEDLNTAKLQHECVAALVKGAGTLMAKAGPNHVATHH